MRLVEKYRPKTFSDIIGQEKAVARIEALLKRGIGGRALLFEGPSGVGKTTTALVLARHLGIVRDNETLQVVQMGSNLDIRFYRAKEMDQRAVEELRDWLALSNWQAPYKMVIIDEAQTMTKGATDALLSVLETLPERAVVILTTTEAEALQDDLFGRQTPFGSRCIQVSFVKPSNAEIAERLVEIAFKECGNGATLPYREIVQEGKGNVRACLQLLETALVAR
ncbi:hypothetical protein AMJ85_11095 [candidate division BRC1 bacterium SM23_51]|nr:MAG: hypothetical protein AMJ85_11095 [candidate division BRC1 bacterium SM23_51]